VPCLVQAAEVVGDGDGDGAVVDGVAVQLGDGEFVCRLVVPLRLFVVTFFFLFGEIKYLFTNSLIIFFFNPGKQEHFKT
jgi:hypothetical protein